MKFWQDKEKNILEPNLLSETAKKWTYEIYESTRDNRGGHDDKKNKSSQIRKFFDEVIKYKTDLLATPAENGKEDIQFKQKLPYIKMISAKLAYSNARKLITKECENLFRDGINSINDRQDFYAFADFFEAFVAFYKQYNNK